METMKEMASSYKRSCKIFMWACSIMIAIQIIIVSIYFPASIKLAQAITL